MARPRNHKNPAGNASWLPTAFRLQSARVRAGITQRELAVKLGVNVSTVAHYELGTRSIPIARLAECARILCDQGLMPLDSLAVDEKSTQRRSSNASDHQFAYSDDLYRWWLPHATKFAQSLQLTRHDVDAGFEYVLSHVASTMRIELVGTRGDIRKVVTSAAEEVLPLVENRLRGRRERSSAAV